MCYFFFPLFHFRLATVVLLCWLVSVKVVENRVSLAGVVAFGATVSAPCC